VLSPAKAGTMRAAITAKKVEERIVLKIVRKASRCGSCIENVNNDDSSRKRLNRKIELNRKKRMVGRVKEKKK